MTAPNVLKILCALPSSPGRRDAKVAGKPTRATLEIEPAALSYATWQPIADRLCQGTVCELKCPPQALLKKTSSEADLEAVQRSILANPETPSESELNSLEIAEPTLGALFDAIALNEHKLVTTLHEAGVKRFFARHEETWLQSDKRVIVVDSRFEAIMEYEDPFGALEVFERLSAAKVVARKDLRILEWSAESWIPLEPKSIEPWPINTPWEESSAEWTL